MLVRGRSVIMNATRDKPKNTALAHACSPRCAAGAGISHVERHVSPQKPDLDRVCRSKDPCSSERAEHERESWQPPATCWLVYAWVRRHRGRQWARWCCCTTVITLTRQEGALARMQHGLLGWSLLVAPIETYGMRHGMLLVGRRARALERSSTITCIGSEVPDARAAAETAVGVRPWCICAKYGHNNAQTFTMQATHLRGFRFSTINS